MAGNEAGKPTPPDAKDGLRLPHEHVQVFESDILADSMSDKARENVNNWQSNWRSGRIIILRDCADARQGVSFNTVSEQSSVSTAFPNKDEYQELYTSGGAYAIVNQTHFDRKKSRIGERPVGCGGQDTKALIETGQVHPESGITHWVDKNVRSPDPLVHSLIQAKETARVIRDSGRDGKIFVVTQDHRSGEKLPVGEIRIEDGTSTRVIPAKLEELIDARSRIDLQRLYRPEAIYSDGIPEVPDAKLSDEFLEYLEEQARFTQEMHFRYPDYSERTEVQNPPWFVISDSKIPFHLRYPTIFSDFDSAFRIHLPRFKDKRMGAFIEDASQMDGVDQMHYAVEQSYRNHADPSKSFSKTNAMLVETADIDASSELARKLLKHRWMQKWLQLPGHQLFTAESRGGQTFRVQEIKI